MTGGFLQVVYSAWEQHDILSKKQILENLNDLNGSDRCDGLWLWELTILAGGQHGTGTNFAKRNNTRISVQNVQTFFLKLGKSVIVADDNNKSTEAMGCHVAQQQLLRSRRSRWWCPTWKLRIENPTQTHQSFDFLGGWMWESAGWTASPVRLIWPSTNLGLPSFSFFFSPGESGRWSKLAKLPF